MQNLISVGIVDCIKLPTILIISEFRSPTVHAGALLVWTTEGKTLVEKVGVGVAATLVAPLIA